MEPRNPVGKSLTGRLHIEGVHRVCSWSVDGRIEKGVDRSLDLVREIPAPRPIKGWVAIAEFATGPLLATREQAIASLEKLEHGSPLLAVIWIEALVGDGL